MSDDFKSFVPPNKNIPELTVFPLLMGILLGIVFGASSLYLALKVGMTVSASIPVAVLSITLFRAFSKILGVRQTTILENNIVQTAGSAGESIAFGVAVTMPALLILGYNMEVSRVMLVASLGALLGILMMIPLRYALIVKGHKELHYPEGTACAEVLIVGERGGTSAKTVFGGFFIGLIYKFLNVGMKLFTDTPSKAISFFKGAAASIEISPELLGVGYIIGPKIASVMVAGGILASWVLIPAIKLFGDGLTSPIFPATKLISEMSLHEIWRSYILYIGAGAVAAGGLISLFRSLPTIVRSAQAGLGGLRSAGVKSGVIRTERDLPLKSVLVGIGVLVIALWWAPQLKLNFVGALLIVLAGFLFVTVSSRITGEVGSSSNPISGMTVATLLLTSVIFLLMGWTSLDYRVTALSVAAVVCVAAANAGATSQDLKTGYIVGATPRAQQIAILVGALTSAIVIGYTLNLLNDASTIYSEKAVPADTYIADVSSLTERERVPNAADSNEYRVFRLAETPSDGPLSKLPAGKYLVDETGRVRFLVDPGINGALKERDDGASVTKYEAPKARLMSLIIDGILTQKLPWGLVLLGVAIALVLELCGIGSLTFAVGVYLPLSASTPIFAGGVIRWIADEVRSRRSRKKASEEDEASSPGVLLSSGLIAGGSIAGIAIAILSVKEGWGSAMDFSHVIPAWMAEGSGFAMIPFVILSLTLLTIAVKAKRAS
jgi:putative OPT family oligopeptide transporter